MHVLFRLRKNARRPEALAVIYCRITVNGVRAGSEFSTFIKVVTDQWDQHAQRVKGKSLKAQDDNAKLDQIRSKLRGIELDLTYKNKHVTADIIQQFYLGKSEEQLTLLQVYDRFIEKQGKKVGISIAKATFDIYQIRRKNLELYLQSVNSAGLPPDQFNSLHAEEFALFLRSTKSCSQDYTMKNLQTIKQVLRFAVRQEILIRNPMEGFEFKFSKVKAPAYLTDEEVARIAGYSFPTNFLQRVADLFLFQVYTGFAYIDAVSFHPDHHIRLSTDGKPWVYKARQKSTEQAVLPWYGRAFEPARLILEKYNGQLPRMTNQVYNRLLKEVAQIVGIQKRVNSHIARKTAASRWLNAGVPEATVARMLGHSTTKQLKVYAQVLEQKIAKDVEVLG